MSDTHSPVQLPAWMGDVDPSQVGFPFAPDRSSYTKSPGIAFKQTEGGPLELDLYLPNEPTGSGAPPLVVMIHGGGWQRGGRYQMGLTRWAGYLAEAGLAVASIDYRLAPATRYPDSFADCLDAIDWLVDRADDHGFDATRIALWGDSAGGHLVLLAATSQTRGDFGGPIMRTQAEHLRCVVALYPPTDLLSMHEAVTRGKGGETAMQSFVGRTPEEDRARWDEVSPHEQAHEGVPPTMILQGTRDLLVPHWQATRYAERLVELGAIHELHMVEDAIHGFDRLAPDDQVKSLIRGSRNFLLAHLGAGE